MFDESNSEQSECKTTGQVLRDNSLEKFVHTNLWRSVVAQALKDLYIPENSKTADYLDKLEAFKWLTEDSTDFRMVCDLAGYSHSKIKENARYLISNLKKFRSALKRKPFNSS